MRNLWVERSDTQQGLMGIAALNSSYRALPRLLLFFILSDRHLVSTIWSGI